MSDDVVTQIQQDATRLESYWQYRNQQINADMDRINLIHPVLESDEKKWIDNEPKVFFDTSRALASINPPRFRMPLSINFDAEEKQKMNKAERFIIGIYRTLDNRCMDRGEGYWLWNLAYWVLLGWYSVFTVVKKGDDGPEFVADIWNPLECYPEWDADRLVKFIRKYDTDGITAQAIAANFESQGVQNELKDKTREELVTITNYWVIDNGKVKNAVLVGGELAKPLTWQKKMKRIPIHCGSIGTPDRTKPNWETRRGESIIAANRDMYDYDNEMIGLMATILSENAYPNVILRTRSGQGKIGKMRGYGQEINLKIEDQLELLKHATTPQEANILFNYFGQQKQKGSLPSSVYGSLPFEISGFALSQLLAAVRYKLGPYMFQMNKIVAAVMMDFLNQYRVGKYQGMTLHTENPADMKRGMTYIEEFTPEDVPDRIYLDVEIPISSKFDKTQAIVNARQAVSPPQILSRATLWDTELDIQDIEQEYERIRFDQMMDDQFIRQIETIEQMWKKVEEYELKGATNIAASIRRYIMGLEVQLGIRQGVPTTPGEETAGISPETMPPEMVNSPDVQRAARGIPPPGLNRRAQTDEERRATQAGLTLR